MSDALTSGEPDVSKAEPVDSAEDPETDTAEQELETAQPGSGEQKNEPTGETLMFFYQNEGGVEYRATAFATYAAALENALKVLFYNYRYDDEPERYQEIKAALKEGKSVSACVWERRGFVEIVQLFCTAQKSAVECAQASLKFAEQRSADVCMSESDATGC